MRKTLIIRGKMRKNEEMSYRCEFCSKNFSNKYTLARHQKNSCKGRTTKKNWKCEYCNKAFVSKNNLERHSISCHSKSEYILLKEKAELCKTVGKLHQIIKEKDDEIMELKIKCETGKIEIYDKVCARAMDKSTITNNTMNVHPKLVNLPITNIHPLTEDYVKDQISNGGYTFDNYVKGESGLVDFIYSITMSENDNGDIERNYVCTDPSRDSYHRLVETKEWRKDKGGKFVDVILDTISDKADGYHMRLFDERSAQTNKSKTGYDPDYIYRLNTDMHSGIVRSSSKDRKILRQKIKKETSRKISV